MGPPAVAHAKAFADHTPLNLGAQPEAHASGPSGGDGAMLLHSALAVVVVVAIIVVLYRVLRALSRSTADAQGALEVELLSRTPIGKDLVISVLRVGERVQVVANGSAATTVLRDLSYEQAVQEGLTIQRSPALANVPIREALCDLRNWVDVRLHRHSDPDPQPPTISQILAEEQEQQ